MSVPNGWIDPSEDLVEEGEEAYRKWEESLGPLPEPEELEAEPCEVGILNDPEPPPEEDVPLATVVARQALEIKHLWQAITQLQDKHSELQKMCALSVRTLTEVAERLLKAGQW